MPTVSNRLLSVYGLIALVALVFWPSVVALHGLWTDFDNLGYTHGYALAAVSLWLIFRDRQALVLASVQRSMPALVGLLSCSVVWFGCWRADIRDAYLVLFPAILWLSLYGVCGRRIAFLLAFPVGFLYFTVPAWSWFTMPLQAMTLYVVKMVMPLLGVPTHIEGNLLYVPAGVFEVAGGCSGLHFLIVGLALAALVGELNRDSWRTRILLLATMGVFAVIMNWIRVSTIVLAGQLTNMGHYLITVDHYRFGWALFAVVLILFLWIARKLSVEPERGSTADGALSARGPNSSVSL